MPASRRLTRSFPVYRSPLTNARLAADGRRRLPRNLHARQGDRRAPLGASAATLLPTWRWLRPGQRRLLPRSPTSCTGHGPRPRLGRLTCRSTDFVAGARRDAAASPSSSTYSRACSVIAPLGAGAAPHHCRSRASTTPALKAAHPDWLRWWAGATGGPAWLTTAATRRPVTAVPDLARRTLVHHACTGAGARRGGADVADAVLTGALVNVKPRPCGACADSACREVTIVADGTRAREALRRGRPVP